MLVVLENLSPAERVAFVLHDMFGVPFSEVGEIAGRSPDAARQLASRARRRVRGSVPPPDPDMAQQRRVVDAFLAAARAGDFEALLDVLDPDVVQRIHTAQGDRRATPPAVGAENVARRALARGAPFAPYGRPAIVNGGMGVVVDIEGKRFAVMAMTISNGRIATMDLFLEPIERPESPS
jgi:ketosteroid isomerase-like protein